MGVRGLTSYVNKRKDQYFEHYKLRDCHVVIDGASLSCTVYADLAKTNTILGGDYDKYARAVEKCFCLFKKCNVEPIVVIDGGYEKKKMQTVKKRKEAKMISLLKVKPGSSSQAARTCFPLMMRQVFKDKIREMNITVVQSDLEADSEIAALARSLSCPVLSQDSDFLIYDVLYIPLDLLSFELCNDEKSKYYLSCMVYRVENLLDSFGGLSKKMLPLLATLLGNDYISQNNFKDFYSHVKMVGGKKEPNRVRKVGGILNWLRKETFESAVFKILSRIKRKDRRLIACRMKKNIRGYTDMETPLAAYLPLTIANKMKTDERDKHEMVRSVENGVQESEDAPEIITSKEQNSSSDEGESESSGDEECEGDEVDEADAYQLAPGWLREEARKGNINSIIMTILGINVYFFIPQIEDSVLPHAGITSVPILAHLAGLLVGKKPITYWSREKLSYRKTELSPITSTKYFGNFPCLGKLNTLSREERLLIFTSILGIDKKALECFPDDWKIFISSLLYWSKSAVLQDYHVHSILIMAVLIRTIDSKMGYFRNKRPFMQQYNSKLRIALKTRSDGTHTIKCTNQVSLTVKEAFEKVTIDDCLITFDSILPFFYLDENISTRPRLFCRSLVHNFSDFQVCVDLINSLNGLLLCPYPHCKVANFYNSTFLYNVASNFKKKTNIETFLRKAPSIWNLYNTVTTALNDAIPKKPVKVVKKKRKKKTIVVSSVEKNNLAYNDHESETEMYKDENNCYALLNSLVI